MLQKKGFMDHQLSLLRGDWKDRFKRSGPWVIWLILLCDVAIAYAVASANQSMWPGPVMDLLCKVSIGIVICCSIFFGLHALDPDLKTREAVTRAMLITLTVGLLNAFLHIGLAREVSGAEVKMKEIEAQQKTQHDQRLQEIEAQTKLKQIESSGRAQELEAEARAREAERQAIKEREKHEQNQYWREKRNRFNLFASYLPSFLFLPAALTEPVIEKAVSAGNENFKTVGDILADSARFWICLAGAALDLLSFLGCAASIWHTRIADSNGNNIADRLERIFKTDPERVRMENPSAYAALCEQYGVSAYSPAPEVTPRPIGFGSVSSGSGVSMGGEKVTPENSPQTLKRGEIKSHPMGLKSEAVTAGQKGEKVTPEKSPQKLGEITPGKVTPPAGWSGKTWSIFGDLWPDIPGVRWKGKTGRNQGTVEAVTEKGKFIASFGKKRRKDLNKVDALSRLETIKSQVLDKMKGKE